MKFHVEYWNSYNDNGTVIVLGHVSAPEGGYGIVRVLCSDRGEIIGYFNNLWYGYKEYCSHCDSSQ